MNLDRFFDELWLLMAPDDGGGSGGEGDEDAEEGDSEAGANAFQKALERRNNDGVNLARELWDDNYRFRRKNAKLSNRIKQLETSSTEEGKTVLSKEDTALWEAYKALGTPETLKTTVDEKKQLEKKLATNARETSLRDVASLSNYHFEVLRDADMLAQTRDGKTLSYEVKEVETNGEKVKTAFVKDGDVEKPLVEYAQEHWASLLPSLTVTAADSSQSSGGKFYPPQHQGSGGNQPKTAKQTTEATLAKSYASRAASS